MKHSHVLTSFCLTVTCSLLFSSCLEETETPAQPPSPASPETSPAAQANATPQPVAESARSLEQTPALLTQTPAPVILEIEKIPRKKAEPGDYESLRFQPQYKIYPEDRERLTAADVVGPDGIVYPDFRYAGVPGGIPDLPVAAKLSDFGGNGEDAEDDLPAFLAAIKHIGKQGGGALEIGPGTFYLDAPLLIPQDRIVLRGAGPEKTEIVYRHFPEEGTIQWIYPRDTDSPLTINDYIRAHAHPFGLMEFSIRANGENLVTLGPSRDGTHRYWMSIPIHKFKNQFQETEVEIEVYARWYDGKEETLTRTVAYDPSVELLPGKIRIPNNDAGIHFLGDRHSADRVKLPLAESGNRGDTTITFAVEPDLQPGDGLRLTARPTGEFLKAIASKRRDIPRTQIFEVIAVDGKTVTLNQPLRQDFPRRAGSYGSPVYSIRSCGVENLTYSQPRMLFANGITFQNPWACWVRNVHVTNPGRNPLQIGGKFSEVRDVKLSEAWYRGGGGTGYFAFGDAHDCLAENIDASNLRHAPNIQWGSTGCVIRNSRFISSDAQFHMGFALENLYENCVIDAKRGTGSYGYGLYVQKPEVSIHGPGGGPRNVIYNNDFTSPKSGVYMGGSNEGWIFAYNRFLVDSGPGFILRDHNFDHIILGNVISLQQSGQPAILFEGNGHPGNEILNNIVYGTNTLSQGATAPLLEWDNTLVSEKNTDPPRPQPTMPSLFEWQRAQ